jgi:lysozyme
MKTSSSGRAFIEAFEKRVLKAYWDAPGRVWTIGFGHTDAAGPPHVYPGMLISSDMADNILSSDLMSVELTVDHLVRVPLTQERFDSLMSFEFNTGWLGHPHCSLLNDLNAGNYALAASDFMLYDRASGKVERGLVRRRQGEAQMFQGQVKQALATAGVAA